MSLTNDEYTVLMIANGGASMMPIGRWKKPCADLLQRGLLQATPSLGDPTGQFNLRITDHGKEALAGREQADDAALERAMCAVGRHIDAFKRTVERAAEMLLRAAREHPEGGRDLNAAIDICGREVIAYAKELGHAR